jgi:hypothetical protein
MESIKPMLLISIIGPNTKKANRELVVKVEAKERAKKESTVEQTETSAARSIMARMEVRVPCPRVKIISLGTKT